MIFIKRLEKLERKFFPNDSPYQRPRRRAAIFFSVLGVVFLVYGTVKIMVKFSQRTNEGPAKTHKFLPYRR